MTGPEHYREAERLLAAGEYDESGDEALHARDVAAAQVHATLALAAATALDPLAVTAELSAWGDVAGTKPEPETRAA
jgi:hypothetical protein